MKYRILKFAWFVIGICHLFSCGDSQSENQSGSSFRQFSNQIESLDNEALQAAANVDDTLRMIEILAEISRQSEDIHDYDAALLHMVISYQLSVIHGDTFLMHRYGQLTSQLINRIKENCTIEEIEKNQEWSVAKKNYPAFFKPIGREALLDSIDNDTIDDVGVILCGKVFSKSKLFSKLVEQFLIQETDEGPHSRKSFILISIVVLVTFFGYLTYRFFRISRVKKSNQEQTNQVLSDRLKSNRVKDSAVFRHFMELCVKESVPRHSDWGDLEKMICNVYPLFVQNIKVLGNVSEQELRLSLLLKAGFKPVQISKLLVTTKQNVSNIRARLFHRFLEDKSEYKNWDDFIARL